MTFYWKDTNGLTLYQENGSYFIDSMPAENIIINGSYTQKIHNIYFCVEGESEPYYVLENQVVGTLLWPWQIIPELKEEDAAAGKQFAGWVSFDTDSDREGSFEMPDKDVYFHTCWRGEWDEDTSMVSITFLLGRQEDEEFEPLGYWDGIYLKRGVLMQLPNFQKEGYTLEWEELLETDEYVYDPLKHTFMFKDIDGQASVNLNAYYVKNEE